MKCFFILLMFFFTCSCKSEKKEMQYDDSNVYSLAIDYCETNPIDSSYTYTGEEDYIPYCYLGLEGKTLDEVVHLLGSPIYEKIDTFYIVPNVSWDDYLMETITSILQNCGDKVPVYTNTWRPRKNKRICVWVYFVKDDSDLRVIYAEQEDERKRIME